jgi:predicted N-acetyltransferase YhbS
MIAAVRLTAVSVGNKGEALLLGPLAVDPVFAGQGYGRALVGHALEAARAAGVRLAVLVGDESYYGKLGFRRIPRGQIALPGPVDPDRLLAAELAEGSLAEYSGLIVADQGT